ncbi:C2 family cysteine protease [bacterium]|nr:C2 family cysteine protease [bacterium]
MREDHESKALAEGDIDPDTKDFKIVDGDSFKNFKGQLQQHGDIDYVQIELDIEKWYSFEVGGSMEGDVTDPRIELLTKNMASAVNGSGDGGTGLNGIVKYKPSEAGIYYLKIQSDAPADWPESVSLGKGTYVVEVTGGAIGPHGHWLSSQGVPERFSNLPTDDVASGISTSSSAIISDRFSGIIDMDGDRDWFRYTLEKSKIYRWNLAGITLRKPSVNLRDSQGNKLEEDVVTGFNGDGTLDTHSTIVFTTEYAGDYFIEVYSNEDIGDIADQATDTFNLHAIELTDDHGGSINYANDGFNGWPNYIPEAYNFAEAGYLQAGERASGHFYSSGDHDFFGVDLLAQNSYTFNIFSGTAHSKPDPYAMITLYDDEGLLFDKNLGYNGKGRGFENITPETDGYYFIKASSDYDFPGLMDYTITSSYFADDYPTDRFTLGLLKEGNTVSGNIEAEGDRDWIRVDLTAGKRYNFTLGNSPNGTWLKLKGPRENPNLFIQRRLEDWGTAESAYAPDIGSDTSGAYPLPLFDDDRVSHMKGLISYDDKDWIAADLKEGIVYQIYLIGKGDNVHSPLPDPAFSIFDSEGEKISDANNNADTSEAHAGTPGRDAEMLFTAPSSGLYYVEVKSETQTPLRKISADAPAEHGATSIKVKKLEESFEAGTTLYFSNGSTFVLTANVPVTEVNLTGNLTGSLEGSESAYASWIVLEQSAPDQATQLEVKPLSHPISKDTTLILSNGATFLLTEKANAQVTELKGLLSGAVQPGDTAYTAETGRYSLAIAELPVDTVAQHYNGVENGNVSIDWTPGYTAPYFIEVGCNIGSTGAYTVSSTEMPDLSGQDQVGASKDDAPDLAFGVQTRAVIDYGGDRDWYRVRMIPGESYQFDLAGDSNQAFNRQSPLIKVYDARGKPKGGWLDKWSYDRNWGKPGGAYEEASTSQYSWSPPQDRYDYTKGSEITAETFYLEVSANTPGNIDFAIKHLQDDQPENMTTQGLLKVGGVVSGTWEKGVENGGNEALNHGTHGGDGDWYRAELENGVTYKIDLSTHVLNRPSIRIYTEHGVYFFDNQRDPNSYDESLLIETIKDGHSQMTFTANRSGSFFINAWNTKTWGIQDGGSGNHIYTLSLHAIADDIKSNIDTVTSLDVDSSVNAPSYGGQLERKNDRDWFKIKLVRGGVYRFDVTGQSLKDPSLRIRDSLGRQLLYNDQIDGWWNPSITYTANETGIYFLDVSGLDIGSYVVASKGLYIPPAGAATFFGKEIEISNSVATDYINDAESHTIGNLIIDAEIELDGDRKWYKVRLEQTRSYEFHQFGDNLQSPSMFLRDENGNPVFPCAKRDKARSTKEKLVLTYLAPSTGDYYLDAGGYWSSIYNQDGTIAGSPTGSFSIQTKDLGLEDARALSWNKSFQEALGDVRELSVGATISEGKVTDAASRALIKTTLLKGAIYTFRVNGGLINGEEDLGVKSRLFLFNEDGNFITDSTAADLRIQAEQSAPYYIAVGATTGQATGSSFKQSGVHYGFNLKIIQERAAKTLPSVDWFGRLKLLSDEIQTMVRSEDADGILDRSELLTILNAVKDEGVSEDELTDLRILAANYEEVNLSRYMVTLLDNLVNGDQANQYFTGRDSDTNMGNTARQEIGNLYAGSSESRVEKLISKWFHGTDSPAAPQRYTYLDLPLFFDGARAADVTQGQLGDCYLLSSLSAIAESSIASIDGRHPSVYPGDMFVDNQDGTYGVRFYDNHGAERWVTVDKYVPGYRANKLANANTVSQETWAMLAEKAYVQLNESDNIGQDGTNRYGIGNHFGIAGGSASLALSHISGQESSHKFITEGSSLNQAELIDMVDRKLPMVFSTSAPCALASLKGVKRKHTYTYESYDVTSGTFFLRNPWGNSHANVTFEDLQEMGSNLAYLDGTREQMQRIDPLQSRFAVSDSSAYGDSGEGDTGLILVESNGNRSLFKDAQSNLYAGINELKALPVTLNGRVIKLSTNGREAKAAENILGVNQILWENIVSGPLQSSLQTMSFNAKWQFINTGSRLSPATPEHSDIKVAFSKAEKIRIAGKVLLGGNDAIPVPDATFTITQNGGKKTFKGDSKGEHAYDLDSKSSLTLAVEKDGFDNASRGVDVRDIVEMRNHILSRKPFDKSTQMVAGDVNMDSSIDVIDIVAMRNVILGRNDHFSKDGEGNRKPVWRFLKNDYLNVQPAKAFESLENYSSLTFSDLQSDVSNAHFLGLKLGDVNFDWSDPNPHSPANVHHVIPETVRPFDIVDYRLAEQDEWMVEIHANSEFALMGLQFELSWDDSVLRLAGIETQSLDGFNDQTHVAKSEGNAVIAWDDITLRGVKPSPGDPVISLRFVQQPGADRGTPIRMTNQLLVGLIESKKKSSSLAAYYHPEGSILTHDTGPIRSMRFMGGQLFMEFETVEGSLYSIEYCNDLSNGVWQQLETLKGNGFGRLFKLPMTVDPQVYFRVQSIDGLTQ